MKKSIIACLIVLVLTILIAAGIVWIISSQNRINLSGFPDIQELKTNFIFMKAVDKCDTWFSISVLWLVVEYLIVILPFELTATILYIEHKEEGKNRTLIILLSVLSMAMIIMANVIRPHDHMEGYRKAYVRLDNAINLYIEKEDKDDMVLINALNEGECYISGGYDVDNNFKTTD